MLPIQSFSKHLEKHWADKITLANFSFGLVGCPRLCLVLTGNTFCLGYTLFTETLCTVLDCKMLRHIQILHPWSYSVCPCYDPDTWLRFDSDIPVITKAADSNTLGLQQFGRTAHGLFILKTLARSFYLSTPQMNNAEEEKLKFAFMSTR